MTLLESILLGIVQGLTEFIPVSSTAHLLIAQDLLGLPAGDLMFAFLVIIQLGTVLSLIALFWEDLWSILRATPDCRHASFERTLGLHIILATIPAALVGYLLRGAVEALFRQPLTEAAIRLFSAAIFMTLAELLGRRTRGLDSMTWLDAVFVGLCQVIAVFPGASRSGATIGGGMLRGLDRPAAARFAFLISIPIMLGAGGYQVLDVIHVPGLAGILPAILAGFASAAVVGWFAARWLLGYLNRHSLYAFAAYCGAAGLAALLLRSLA